MLSKLTEKQNICNRDNANVHSNITVKLNTEIPSQIAKNQSSLGMMTFAPSDLSK